MLNWNGWKDTIACVESILDLGHADFSLLIVDNGSTDGSEERIRAFLHEKKRPQPWEVLQTGANLGYAGGNNAGLRRAMEDGWADYIWLLNNDTVVDKDALSAMLSCFKNDPQTGMAGSKLLYHNRPSVIQGAGGCRLTPWFGNTALIGNDVPDGKGRHDEKENPDYISGASLLVKKEVIKKIGVFDENYFLYWEDADWGIRARRAGYGLIYCPESRVFHKEGGTCGKTTQLTDYYWVRNGLYFTKKFYPWFLPSALPAYLFKYLVLRPLKLKKGPANAKALFRGIFDFLRSRTGKMLSDKGATG